MKELIPRDEYGIFCDNTDTIRIDSRDVARIFGKRHAHVIRDIEKINEPKSGSVESFNRLNFQPVKYKDEKGEMRKAYLMTRDGFTLLVMGYTGVKAMRFKIAYIQRFKEMENQIADLKLSRNMFPKLTDMVRRVHDDPKPYHFSNECDMINRLVTGMSAKQYREAHGLQKGESIRPHLTAQQIHEMEHLQNIDIGLLIAVPDFAARKEILQKELEGMRV